MEPIFLALSRYGIVAARARRAGILNIGMQVANVHKLHAVIGGFHLGMAPPEYIRHTVDALAALDPDVIIPMHCSGAPFIEDELPPVWPHPDGPVRGPGILPLYERLPLAAIEDPLLYELLALFDALRIGQARER